MDREDQPLLILSPRTLRKLGVPYQNQPLVCIHCVQATTRSARPETLAADEAEVDTTIADGAFVCCQFTRDTVRRRLCSGGDRDGGGVGGQGGGKGTRALSLSLSPPHLSLSLSRARVLCFIAAHVLPTTRHRRRRQNATAYRSTSADSVSWVMNTAYCTRHVRRRGCAYAVGAVYLETDVEVLDAKQKYVYLSRLAVCVVALKRVCVCAKGYIHTHVQFVMCTNGASSSNARKRDCTALVYTRNSFIMCWLCASFVGCSWFPGRVVEIEPTRVKVHHNRYLFALSLRPAVRGSGCRAYCARVVGGVATSTTSGTTSPIRIASGR